MYDWCSCSIIKAQLDLAQSYEDLLIGMRRNETVLECCLTDHRSSMRQICQHDTPGKSTRSNPSSAHGELG